MLMHSLHLVIVYGGIGVITPMDGVVILTMDMVGIIGMVLAGASAGAAGTAVAGMDGDIIITIIIIIPVVAGIPVADIGEVADTGVAMPIPTDALMVQPVILQVTELLALHLVVLHL